MILGYFALLLVFPELEEMRDPDSNKPPALFPFSYLGSDLLSNFIF